MADGVDNFEDLLNLSLDDIPVDPAEDDFPPEPPEEIGVVESPEAVRIRELKAALAAPMPSFEEPEAVEVELTPQQREIKELEDQLAKRNAVIAENAPAQYAKAGKGEKILIHFKEDGFIALGQVWYRGQELEFEIGGKAYLATKDRRGESWVDLAANIPAQEAKWGRQMIGTGPFIPRPGEKFDDDLAREDARRNRAVPLISN